MNASSTTLFQNAVVYACAEETCGLLPAAERELLHETGRVLLTIGHLVTNVPPLEQHASRGTADLLISLGNKLAAQ